MAASDVSQYQILNKILSTKDFSIITLNNLSADYFPDYENEFNYIKDYVNQFGQVPDSLTFKSKFEDFEFSDVHDSDLSLVSRLIKDHNDAEVVKAINAIVPLYNNGDEHASEKALKILSNALANSRPETAFRCTNLITDRSRFQHFEDRINNDPSKYFIKTGLDDLDKILGGFDRQNELGIIAARSGVGKTWILLKFAVEASAQGLSVGIYSGEMTADKVGYRIDTMIMANLTKDQPSARYFKNSDITRGSKFTDPAIEQSYRDYTDKLSTLKSSYGKAFGPIKVITPADISGPATVDSLRAFIEQEHLDILFVDQYSLLEAPGRYAKSYEKVAEISKQMKLLQVQEQIPIIAVSQMNRTKNEDDKGEKTQDLTQIALSDRIGQDATFVIMLDRKDDPNDQNEFYKRQELTLNIVKSRDGGDGRKLTYIVDFNTGKFNKIDDSNSPSAASAALQAEFEGGADEDL